MGRLGMRGLCLSFRLSLFSCRLNGCSLSQVKKGKLILRYLNNLHRFLNKTFLSLLLSRLSLRQLIGLIVKLMDFCQFRFRTSRQILRVRFEVMTFESLSLIRDDVRSDRILKLHKNLCFFNTLALVKQTSHSCRKTKENLVFLLLKLILAVDNQTNLSLWHVDENGVFL